MDTSKRLSPGRHQLSRDEVRDNQRERILAALETVMSAKGYGDTSVADVIKSAGVSRQTFYELFCSKQDCFLASYATRQASVIALILSTAESDPPMSRFDALLKTYLAVMAANPARSRLFLIGVYAAGPEGVAARLALQQEFVDGVADVFGARSEQARFDAQVLVAAISTLVTNALLDDDPQAVLNLYEPLTRVARQVMSGE
ncbi:TetR/AcrR family transcriptional regulator [Mycolicibacterium sp.]|uniref:TetR/AcrR family transcriptional regulator n=1 Tax=Mycolicibacterium sp. TaxID=2320850 RepID=UPI001A2D2EDE|nr:TetR/AcrR family transcriptional regulator [Mycolicibacterium sp.]MBJ7340704.1 TetR/AcrR family transcriptional regulator [Mycolicibacterium sp.]